MGSWSSEESFSLESSMWDSSMCMLFKDIRLEENPQRSKSGWGREEV